MKIFWWQHTSVCVYVCVATSYLKKNRKYEFPSVKTNRQLRKKRFMFYRKSIKESFLFVRVLFFSLSDLHSLSSRPFITPSTFIWTIEKKNIKRTLKLNIKFCICIIQIILFAFCCLCNTRWNARLIAFKSSFSRFISQWCFKRIFSSVNSTISKIMFVRKLFS